MAHRDQFVWRLSLCLSASHTFVDVTLHIFACNFPLLPYITMNLPGNIGHCILTSVFDAKVILGSRSFCYFSGSHSFLGSLGHNFTFAYNFSVLLHTAMKLAGNINQNILTCI